MTKPLLAAALACVALAGCKSTYGLKPASSDDPNAAKAEVALDDVATLRLRGVELAVESIDDEPTRETAELLMYAGKRKLRVIGTTTAMLDYRHVRIPLRSCAASLEFVAQPKGTYSIVSEDLWQPEAKIQIVDDASGKVVAAQPCTRISALR